MNDINIFVIAFFFVYTFEYDIISFRRVQVEQIYDVVIAGIVILYLILFISVNLILHPEITQETLLIRATATLALFLLHIILSIGPLARLNPVFLPLLYNRRHLGVTMFCIAAIHGVFSVIQFHSLGDVNPFLSIFISNTHYGSISKFPFLKHFLK